jgi:ketosteroid isomerase-like protein
VGGHADGAGRVDGFDRFEPVDLHVHRTEDPEVVITEFRYEGSAGGRPVRIPNIFVTRVRDGMIVESRDYADHSAGARAFGDLSAPAEKHG